MLGSRLFLRRVSGARVVVGKTTSVGGVTLHQFGVHSSAYPHVYLTAAAGLGATEQDIDLFIEVRRPLSPLPRSPPPPWLGLGKQDSDRRITAS